MFSGENVRMPLCLTHILKGLTHILKVGLMELCYVNDVYRLQLGKCMKAQNGVQLIVF